MAKPEREFKPHKVQCIIGPHGVLVRFCERCGESWELRSRPKDIGHAWYPIAELDDNETPIGGKVDITYCGAEPEAATPQPTAAKTADERRCYCGDCHKAGRKEHYPNDEMCYCPRHKGRERHKLP